VLPSPVVNHIVPILAPFRTVSAPVCRVRPFNFKPPLPPGPVVHEIPVITIEDDDDPIPVQIPIPIPAPAPIPAPLIAPLSPNQRAALSFLLQDRRRWNAPENSDAVHFRRITQSYVRAFRGYETDRTDEKLIALNACYCALTDFGATF
jgi:hypothetical protein